jgi:hypothetical protein
MYVTRRKRRENTDVCIYLNNKPLEQATNIKYLGIILDRKLNFREHIIHTSRKCTTLIHALAKSAKLSWGLNHEALNTTYKGAIFPLMLYGTPVWIGAMEKNCNRTLYNRVQRLMNIKIAKGYRTTSNDAHCILTGTTPIQIKAVGTANIYRLTGDTPNHQLEHEAEPKDWTQLADSESANKMKQRSRRSNYSQMEVRTNTVLDREPPPPHTHTCAHTHTVHSLLIHFILNTHQHTAHLTTHVHLHYSLHSSSFSPFLHTYSHTAMCSLVFFGVR